MVCSRVIRRCYPGCVSGKGYRKVHRRMLGKQLFDELVRQLAPRRTPRNSGLPPAGAPGTLSDPPSERARASEPNVGTTFCLVSLGGVAIATVIVFFGLGFFLLAHPNEELIAGDRDRDRGTEVEPRRSDLVPSQGKDAATLAVQTELSHPATAPSDTLAANATFDAPSSQELPGLRSNPDEAAAAAPAGVTQAKRTGSGRHRHAAAQRHWHTAGNDRLPQAVSGPEKAWHWIVHSASSILAALSPPPPRQAPGFRTR